MLLVRLLIISTLFFYSSPGKPGDKTIFISPVKIPLLLSANFGELRIDHFHSGLDIKTQGVTGKEVVAAASGYIYRISVSPGGFGNALYVRHPSGYSTVYGHLERFMPEVADYVNEQQYAKKSFTITLFPPKDKFPVRQGELIAYSGNSGSSGGPHLHYEIRESATEMPVNPLLFEFGMSDNIAPVIEKLAIYPANTHTLIDNRTRVETINVTGHDGQYFIPDDKVITIHGAAGFGIKSFDRLDGSTNKCSVYSIELSIDSTSIFKYIMDGFSFAESRYINSHIDYETYLRNNIYIERLFMLPNDKLSVYKEVMNRGIYNFTDDTLHLVQVVVNDVHNNKSVLTFRVKAQTANSIENHKTIAQNLQLMPYNRTNIFESENLKVRIPSGALYDTIYFSYQHRSGTRDMLSDLHIVHNKYTPVHKAYTLAIRPNVVPAGKKSKMVIVQSENDQIIAQNSTWDNEYLKADVMSFGSFYIGIDTISPVISAIGLVSGADMTGKREIKIRISDDFSGIKTYEPAIDGNWVLFEYDQKYNLLTYRFDEKRISKGKVHELTLKVTDNTNNSSYYNCDFTW